MEEPGLSAEEFLKRIQLRFESEEAARYWFETEPLPGFSGATAQQLIAAGRSADLLDFISATDAEIYS